MCSDGRYRAATDEFVARHLGIADYDIVAVPGGAYFISFADALPKQLKVGMRLLRFVIKSNATRRVILVAHQDCGRYIEGFASFLRRPGFSIEEKQRHDLAAASKDLDAAFPNLAISSYYARQVQGTDQIEFGPA